ncbi:sugar ABC transporter ATP-binding protein [Rhizobium sp. P32RR-XVIII]|uniref:sugar ABC transporter ATP-binding protein n=1 Tax=Rhizobium sp. P32RR-XVIII TaxID=2726738 RepID=UPI0014573477|nr:sugar ABC transporter ATP-binding protein [Rhizobium sp. P32RR-XVIII]NLS07343.1 sugar ABC transporter ATP-binding protein [Rhizobium sp. P32RR-XVIII]
MLQHTKLLSARQITKIFGVTTVLRNIDFDIDSGEVHALIGENGAGKSTLMNILSGNFPPTSGTIWIDGKERDLRNPSKAIDAGIAMMHQEPKVAPPLSIAENVLMGRLPRKGGFVVDYGSLHEKVNTILRDVGVSFDASTPIEKLSIAQRQLVQLARAISQNAKLIVLDEPTASLTPVETDNLFSIIRRLKERNVAFIYISHHLDEIFQIADRVTVLRDGSLVTTNTIAETTKADLIRLMVGRELGSHFPSRRNGKAGDVVLEAANLSGPGFKDVSLTLRRGEIVGLAGLVGAGRTELARSLCGASIITSGDLALEGRQVRPSSPADAVASGIAYLAEDRHDSVLRSMSVAHNITLAGRRKFSKVGVLRTTAERAAASEFVKQLKIVATSVEQPAGQLSGGNQQKCVIARWLLQQPKVIIFDEPTRGIDVGAKRDIYGLIHRLADEGCAILMISSELPEVINISDRVMVMCEGRISGEVVASETTEAAVIALAVPSSRGSLNNDKH